ncbi:MAG: SH3 domain-containing protein [Aureispira sp.]
MPSNRPRRPQQEDKPVPKPTKGRLNNIELTAIGLIGFAILLYAFSKCGEEPTPDSTAEQPIVTEQVMDSSVVAIDSNQTNGSSFSAAGNNSTPVTTAVTANSDSLRQPRKLYILADSLRLRQSPELSGAVLAYLGYGEEVLDMGESTALQKLRVSVDEIRQAPWVKVKTKKGKIGWAFGAYMQFYPVPRSTANNQ